MGLVRSPRRFVTDHLGQAGSVTGRGESRSRKRLPRKLPAPCLQKARPAGSRVGAGEGAAGPCQAERLAGTATCVAASCQEGKPCNGRHGFLL